MITSTSNQRVKQITQWQEKARARRQDGVFLAEGLKMYQEAPTDLVREVYLTECLLEQLKNRRQESDQNDINIEEKLEKTGFELVTQEVFARMSDTQTPGNSHRPAKACL